MTWYFKMIFDCGVGREIGGQRVSEDVTVFVQVRFKEV